MKIYTKTGDGGETSLFGGKRVSKGSARIDAYGTVDELNAFLGLTILAVKSDEIKKLLSQIQSMLFTVGGDLATPENNSKVKIERTPDNFIIETEQWIDKYNNPLSELKNFILPGGTEGASLLHICRTIARRAERKVIQIDDEFNVRKNIVVFLNRLSDLFFVLARYENNINKVPDITWTNTGGS